MKSVYLNSLSADDYKQLTLKLHSIQNGKCYICGQDIDLDIHTTNIDHIVPLNTGGLKMDNEQNMALTHESCNKSKQDANLAIARCLHKLKIIQDKVQKEENRAASLKDLLALENGSKFQFSYKIEGDDLVYSFQELNDVEIRKSHIFTDERSGERTCFVEIPLEYLYHDEIINPRGINSSINLLVKEFYKGNPQLHLTLGRIDNNLIKVFDGQHKAVAQILLGARKILLRLFIDSDVNKLTETNANAGSKLRQIAFDKAIMRQLNNTQYQEKVRLYKEEHQLGADEFSFSEQQLCDYFKGERLKVYIIDALKSSITSSPDNKMKDFIDFEGKGKSLPLSHSTYDKVFLAKFIDSKRILTTPLDFKAGDGMNPRELEIMQISRLLSLITEIIYVGKFNQEVGLYKLESRVVEGRDADISDDHLAAYRISKEEILYAWIPYLGKIIQMYFLNNGINYVEGSLFQTQFPEQLWKNLSNFIRALASLPLWKDRSMASTHFSGKKTQDFWNTVFETGKTPEGVQVLANKISYMGMIMDVD